MHARHLVALLAIAASRVYATGEQSSKWSLAKRQGGDAFVPGSTIVTSCSADELECGTDWCYTPSEGQVCCSEGYPCPDGSFCLTQGYCCPDGDSPQDCARANGVTLPANFNTAPAPATSAAPSTSSPATEPSATSDLSALPSTTATPVAPFPTTTSAPAAVPPAGTGTGTGAITKVASSSLSLYTGAAGGHAAVDGGMALVLGLLGYLV